MTIYFAYKFFLSKTLKQQFDMKKKTRTEKNNKNKKSQTSLCNKILLFKFDIC